MPIVERSGPTHCPLPLHAMAARARVCPRPEEDGFPLLRVSVPANQFAESAASSARLPSWAGAELWQPGRESGGRNPCEPTSSRRSSSQREACPHSPGRGSAARRLEAVPGSAAPPCATRVDNRAAARSRDQPLSFVLHPSDRSHRRLGNRNSSSACPARIRSIAPRSLSDEPVKAPQPLHRGNPCLLGSLGVFCQFFEALLDSGGHASPLPARSPLGESPDRRASASMTFTTSG